MRLGRRIRQAVYLLHLMPRLKLSDDAAYQLSLIQGKQAFPLNTCDPTRAFVLRISHPYWH